MGGYIWEAIIGLGPLFLLGAVIAAAFGVALNRQFADATAVDIPITTGRWIARVGEATSFFLMFSVFGAVTAYFLSRGLKEESLDYVNPMFDSFVTPFIALLTAGVGYVARSNSEGRDAVMVPAGVVCFLLVCTLSYDALFLAKTDGKAEVLGMTLPLTRTPT